MWEDVAEGHVMLQHVAESASLHRNSCAEGFGLIVTDPSTTPSCANAMPVEHQD